MRLHSIRVRRTESLLEVGYLISVALLRRSEFTLLLFSVSIMELWGALEFRTFPPGFRAPRGILNGSHRDRGRHDAQILHGILTGAFLSY